MRVASVGIDSRRRVGHGFGPRTRLTAADQRREAGPFGLRRGGRNGHGRWILRDHGQPLLCPEPPHPKRDAIERAGAVVPGKIGPRGCLPIRQSFSVRSRGDRTRVRLTPRRCRIDFLRITGRHDRRRIASHPGPVLGVLPPLTHAFGAQQRCARVPAGHGTRTDRRNSARRRAPSSIRSARGVGP
jgi:hypothetical protein